MNSNVNKDEEKVGFKGYAALIFAVIFFSGIFSKFDGPLKALDFQTYVGAFGQICENAAKGFIGTGGSGVREGFLQALSIAPIMIFAVGFIGCIEYLGGLKAAQKLLTPVLRFLMGIPGVCAIAMVLNWQSSDASAAEALNMYNKGIISRKERERLVAYEFITAATIGVFFSNGAVILPYFTISTGLMLIILIANKFIAGNLMRLFQLLFDKKEDQYSENKDTALKEAKKEEEKKVGLIQTFMNKGKIGFSLWMNNLVPAMLFGYVVVVFLNVTGLMDVFGVVFTPIMRLFGLPGEAATCILTSYMTLPAGCAMAAALVEQGTLTARQVTVLFPMMYAVASNLLYIGRVLGGANVDSKKYPVYIVIGIVCACLGGLVLNIIA